MKKILVMAAIILIVALGMALYYAAAVTIFICGMGNLKLKKWIRGALVILAIFLFYAGIVATVYVYRYGIPKF